MSSVCGGGSGYSQKGAAVLRADASGPAASVDGGVLRPLPAADAPARPASTPTLTDSFGRHHTYLRISLTDRCNLRCQYCMPEEGVDVLENSKLLTAAEISKLAHMFVRAGVTKIRLTGGEPLVRKDVVEICRELGSIPGLQTLAITTNGITLGRKMADLKSAGVQALNISLDTLVPGKFTMITRRLGWERVWASITQALEMGFQSVKVNVVVMKGVNDDELGELAGLTRSMALDVRFIEYMPFDDNKWSEGKFIPYSTMIKSIEQQLNVGLVKLPNEAHDTSKAYKIPGAVGQLGFITSMSEHFCGSCNRLRLTQDGNLKVCLFGSQEVSLRDALRAGAKDEDIEALIQAAVWSKAAKLGGHADMFAIAAGRNRPMITIGG